MSPGLLSAVPRSSSPAAIASGSRCYSLISSASCDLADLDCAARAAHKMSSHSAPSRKPPPPGLARCSTAAGGTGEPCVTVATLLIHQELRWVPSNGRMTRVHFKRLQRRSHG